MFNVQGKPLIFICGHRKCGTSLLLHLLDGHPELLVYPVDLGVLYAYYPYYVGDVNQLRRVIFGSLDRYVGKAHTAEMMRHWPPPAFDPKSVITWMLESWHQWWGPEDPRAIVVKETSAEIYAPDITKWFPRVQFVQMHRDPRDVYAAIKAGVEKHYSQLGETAWDCLASLIFRWQTEYPVGDKPANIQLVSFRNLVRFTRSTIDSIWPSEREIPMVPTIASVPTHGNNYDGQQWNGVCDKNIGRWRDRITEEEASIIRYYLLGGPFTKAVQEFYKWANQRHFFHNPFPPADK